MSALYAGTAAQREEYAVDDVAEHAASLVANFDAAAAQAPAAVVGQYTRVRPEVTAYAEAAKAIVARLATDHRGGGGAAAGFLEPIRRPGERPRRDRRRDAAWRCRTRPARGRPRLAERLAHPVRRAGRRVLTARRAVHRPGHPASAAVQC